MLNHKKYTAMECFHSSLLENLGWLTLSHHVYVLHWYITSHLQKYYTVYSERGQKGSSSSGRIHRAICSRFLFYKQEKHGFPGELVQST